MRAAFPQDGAPDDIESHPVESVKLKKIDAIEDGSQESYKGTVK